jgi:hypothetical protein
MPRTEYWRTLLCQPQQPDNRPQASSDIVAVELGVEEPVELMILNRTLLGRLVDVADLHRRHQAGRRRLLAITPCGHRAQVKRGGTDVRQETWNMIGKHIRPR